jgi:hypothetical protein
MNKPSDNPSIDQLAIKLAESAPAGSGKSSRKKTASTMKPADGGEPA